MAVNAEPWLDGLLQIGRVIAPRTDNPLDDFGVLSLEVWRNDQQWVAELNKLLSGETQLPPGTMPLRFPPGFTPPQQLNFFVILQLLIQYGPQILELIQELFGSQSQHLEEPT